MKIKDILICPVCNGDKFNRKNKTFITCEKCGAKIGITNDKLWYEYAIKDE
jgi:ribosomal protein L37AE/L43A